MLTMLTSESDRHDKPGAGKTMATGFTRITQLTGLRKRWQRWPTKQQDTYLRSN